MKVARLSFRAWVSMIPCRQRTDITSVLWCLITAACRPAVFAFGHLRLSSVSWDTSASERADICFISFTLIVRPNFPHVVYAVVRSGQSQSVSIDGLIFEVLSVLKQTDDYSSNFRGMGMFKDCLFQNRKFMQVLYLRPAECVRKLPTPMKTCRETQLIISSIIV